MTGWIVNPATSIHGIRVNWEGIEKYHAMVTYFSSREPMNVYNPDVNRNWESAVKNAVCEAGLKEVTFVYTVKNRAGKYETYRFDSDGKSGVVKMNLTHFNKVTLLAVTAFCLLAGCGSKKEELVPEFKTLPMVAVLANPQQFENKKISLYGYFMSDVSQLGKLYMDKQSYEDGVGINAIKVDMRMLGKPENYFECSGKPVVISGTAKHLSQIFNVDLIITDIQEFRRVGSENINCISKIEGLTTKQL